MKLKNFEKKNFLNELWPFYVAFATNQATLFSMSKEEKGSNPTLAKDWRHLGKGIQN